MIHHPKIGGITFASSVMNAACSIAKTFDDVELLCKTKIGAVLIGSITLKSREGNPEPRWHDRGDWALNSFGMPNGGLTYYKNALPKMARLIHDAQKVFVVSIAGFSIEEYVELAGGTRDCGVDLLELNFGCPNIREEGGIISFDTNLMREIIEKVSKVTKVPIMVKLSPYSNPLQLKEVALMLAKQKIAAVVTSNSFPNGYISDGGKDVVATSYAGMNGKALLPISLGQVRQFRELLPRRIAIIGVGGIESKEDTELYLNAGASAVQAATFIVRNGHLAI